MNNYDGKDSEETKTAWADYQNKVGDLVAQRDAFNRAKMGMEKTLADLAREWST